MRRPARSPLSCAVARRREFGRDDSIIITEFNCPQPADRGDFPLRSLPVGSRSGYRHSAAVADKQANPRTTVPGRRRRVMTTGTRAEQPVPPRRCRPDVAIASPGRRSLLRGLAVGGVALAPALARAADANPAAPPADPPWTQSLGRAGGRPALWPAVAIREGRDPPQCAVADRHAAILGQLHAVAGPDRHHHRQWIVLRALPRRADQRGSRRSIG